MLGEHINKEHLSDFFWRGEITLTTTCIQNKEEGYN